MSHQSSAKLFVKKCCKRIITHSIIAAGIVAVIVAAIIIAAFTVVEFVVTTCISRSSAFLYYNHALSRATSSGTTSSAAAPMMQAGKNRMGSTMPWMVP